jgi:hypothetical protein
MKDKILELLATRFEGVSSAILGRIAAKLAKTATSEDEAQALVDGVTLQQLVDGEADRRATESAQSAVANYEKKHSLKEGKPVSEGGQGEKTELKKESGGGGGEKSETPDWAKAIIESNKMLSEKLSALEGEKLTSSRRQKLGEVIGKLPESLQKPYNRIPLSGLSDDEFSELIADTAKEVEALAADITAKGSVLKIPKGGSGDSKREPPKELVKEALNNLMPTY